MSSKDRPWWRKLWLPVGGAGLAGLLVYAWIPRPVAVDLSPVEAGPLVLTVNEDGRTRVKDRYIVSAPVIGKMGRLPVRAGDRVQAGQVIARLVPLEPPLLDHRSKAEAVARVAGAEAASRQAQSAITRATTATEFAARELERLQKLGASGSVAPQAIERAELEARARRDELASAGFGARVAEYELQLARAALNRLGKSEDHVEVTSPVEGRVLRVFRESEGVVQPGAPLIEVGDPTALEIVVDVLTTDAVRISPGAKATIEHWGGEPLAAQVRLVEPSAVTRVSALGVEEQRVDVILDLLAPPAAWASLGDGYRVEAKMVVFEAANVLQVPLAAVFRHGDAWAVYRVVEGRAQRVPVELGQRGERTVEVQSGLKAAEVVVSYPGQSLSDGLAVIGR